MGISGHLDDAPDRVHDDLWLVERNDVTRLLRDDQASSFRERRLILLQASPALVGAPSTCHGDDWNRQLATRASDLRRALANVKDLVGR